MLSDVVNLDVIRALGVLLALATITYLVLAIRAVARFPRGLGRRVPDDPAQPPATIMVPVHGLGPGVEDCLRTVCAQAYPCHQILFGLHRPDDPARAAIERLIAEFPERDIGLVIDGRMAGANPKNCNLANMYPAARHDLIVIVDSDVRVPPRFLARVLAPLADPAVGGVTCLYRATAIGGMASALSALALNDWFLPSALVDLGRREPDICYGAAIAVRRAALDRIGGFAGMASAVAQDFVLGQRLVQAGYRVAVADVMVETIAAEPDFATLFRHELRWNRAVRAVRPRDHALSLVMQPLPAVVALSLVPDGPWWALTPAGAMVALRVALHLLVRARLVPDDPARPWLVPVRECLCFAVWTASFASRRVRWGVTTLVMGTDFTMSEARPAPAREAPQVSLADVQSQQR